MKTFLKRLSIGVVLYVALGTATVGTMIFVNDRRASAMRARIVAGADSAALARVLESDPKWFWLNFHGDDAKCGMIRPEDGRFHLVYFRKGRDSTVEELPRLASEQFAKQARDCDSLSVLYQSMIFEKAVFRIGLSSGAVASVGPIWSGD